MNLPVIAALGYLLTDHLISVDHFPVQAGEHQSLLDLEIQPGGMCNFLIAGQHFGGSMRALDSIGDDREGNQLLHLLENEGVDISGVTQVNNARSRSVVVLNDRTGAHVFLPYPGSEMPEQMFSTSMQDSLKSADALYLDGFTLQQSHIQKAAFAAAQWMHSSGKKIFFDPGPHYGKEAAELLPFVDNLFLTRDELTAWLSKGINDAFSIGNSIKWIVVKEGPQGCTIYPRAESPLHTSGLNVQVIDTLGAGDVFNAAFIVSYLCGKPLPECAKFANAAGALMVQKLGAGMNIPELNEVEKALK